MIPTVSVIIVTYNSERDINNCLSSLDKLKSKNFEVIIIDNGSKDNTIQIINNHKNTHGFNIVLIRSKENLGFGKANNIAVKKARGKYLFFLNPDTEIIDENTLDKMIKKLESNPKLGILSPLYYSDRQKIQPKFTYIHSNAFMELVPMDKYAGRIYSKRFVQTLANDKDLIYTDTVSGAHLLIRKSLFDRLNGFDEQFFFYSEETDLCLRCWKLGYSVAWLKNLYIYHFGAGSGFGPFQVKHGVKSRLQFIYKWNDKNNLFWVIIFSLGAILKRILQFRFNEIPYAIEGIKEGLATLKK